MHRILLIFLVGLVARLSAAPAVAPAVWDHVHLTAPDTAKAQAWYADHFGGKKIKAGSFDAIVYGGTTVKFKPSTPETKGSGSSTVDHIGFSVTDVAGKLEEVIGDGGKLVTKPRHVAQGDFDYAFVEDPWGTKIELISDRDLPGFHHIHLMVADREAAVQWYEQTFGTKSSGDFKGLRGLSSIRYGDMWLIIQERSKDRSGTDGHSIDHIGWVFPDLAAAAARMKAQGVKFLIEPSQSGDVKYCFIEGPDGVRIEVQERRTKAD